MSISEVEHPSIDLEGTIFPHLKSLEDPSLRQLYEKIERIRYTRYGLRATAAALSSLALKNVIQQSFFSATLYGLAALVTFTASFYFNKPPPYLILSIDGGGIRGMIPIQILALIEEELGCPIGQVFDCIAGTSIGGILALALTQPDPMDPSSPKIRARDLVDFLEQKGPLVFDRSTLQTIQSIDGVRTPKYSNENLKQVLKEQFDDTRLDQAVADVFIPSYDLSTQTPALFSHFKGTHTQKSLLMRDVGVATAAAPIYFPSYSIGNLNLVDGGIVANNPALLAYMKAAGHIDPNRDIFILSIGTGLMPQKPIAPIDSESFGMIQWLPKIFDLIFQSNQEMLTLQFKLLKHVAEIPLTLLRLQPILKKTSQEQLDNATPRNIQSLKNIATKFFESNLHWLQRDLIQPLIKYRIA